MPIYEYHCDNCEHEFETIQKISEEPLKNCPACKQDRLRKKVSMAAFRLKGGGWYETDFKSGGDKKRNLGGDADTSTSTSTSTKESAPAESSKSSDSASSTAASGTTSSPASGSASGSASSSGSKGSGGESA